LSPGLERFAKAAGNCSCCRSLEEGSTVMGHRRRYGSLGNRQGPDT
jgi:hypothetical protein